jgi:hypothetical protein
MKPIKKKMKQRCGFANRENVGNNYWKDIRWLEVTRLRAHNKMAKANGLVMSIRSDWGVE